MWHTEKIQVLTISEKNIPNDKDKDIILIAIQSIHRVSRREH